MEPTEIPNAEIIPAVRRIIKSEVKTAAVVPIP